MNGLPEGDFDYEDNRKLQSRINRENSKRAELLEYSRGERDSVTFAVKDSGQRQEFESGMVRDTTEGKIDWHRTSDGPMLERWAIHLTKAVKKYEDVVPGVPNWMLARGEAERERARASAYRHFMQWFRGDRDEDHASAVMFNMNLTEYVQKRMDDPLYDELMVKRTRGEKVA